MTTSPAAPRPLWECPACGRLFANRNQSHSCGSWHLDDHFQRCDPAVREIFDRLVEVAQSNGPLIVVAEKTRIALQVRMSFAALVPRRRWLNGHLVLARPVDSPRFLTVQTLSPRNVVHTFRLHGPDEVDTEFTGWLAEAYRVGEQRHLQRRLP